ncbi:MAG: CBS domain-containing protein [Firmicutes bacterium]|nr:CBS domain-containing protein [Bacillota bacterium]
MFVYERMSKNVKKIMEDTPMSRIISYFEESEYSYMPVVNEDEKIIGCVTRKVVDDIKPSKMLYMFGGMKAKEVMQTGIFSINMNKTVEEAAMVIKENHIDALFVTDEGNKIVGIISRLDVYKAFIDVIGLKDDGTRIILKKDDGNICEIAQIAKNYTVRNISKYKTKSGEEIAIAVAEKNTDSLEATLKEYGYEIKAKVD